jgi:anti-sigma factor RsiW
MMTGENRTGGCEMVLLVQAEFDRELDAAQAAHLAAHRSGCLVCRTAETELARVRELFQANLYEPAPAALRDRVLARLDLARPDLTRFDRAEPIPPPRQRFRHFAAWRPTTAGFGLGAACAAALMLFVLAPGEQSLTDQLVSGHVRALQPGHLEDVASSDRHTVKPWFDGRLDFAPPVRDLKAAGFPLIGGRLDYIDGRPVAALVYQRDKHIINLFAWPAAASPASASAAAEKNGYNVMHWVADGMTLWAVSDVERSQLATFASAWREMP